MYSKPQQPLTETEIETLKKMQVFLSQSFDGASASAASAYLSSSDREKHQLTALSITDTYIRVTDLLRKNRNSGPS